MPGSLAPSGHGMVMKRMLRCYLALIASTGIRAGLEAKRVRLGDVRFTSQHGRHVIFIRVTKNQGKHPKPRSVVVFEGNPLPQHGSATCSPATSSSAVRRARQTRTTCSRGQMAASHLSATRWITC